MDPNKEDQKPTIVVTVRFPREVYDLVKEEADKNRRSISGQIIFLAETGLKADA